MPLKAGARVFAPSLRATFLALLGLAIFLGLGRWQIARMHEKEALLASFDNAAGAASELPQEGGADFAHVQVTGRYDGTRQILLDSMTHEGQAGFQVLTPLRREGGGTLLVNRGWVPGGALRSELPDVSVEGGIRTVIGRLQELPRPGIRMGNSVGSTMGWPRLMNYPRIEDVRAALAQDVDERVILLDANQPDGYVREWRPSTFPPERHLGYAVTWFAMAAAVLVAYVLTALRSAA